MKQRKPKQSAYTKISHFRESGGGKLIMRITAAVLALIILLSVFEIGNLFR